MPISVEELRRQYSAPNTAILMEKLGVRFEGNQYLVRTSKFSSFEEALKFAHDLQTETPLTSLAGASATDLDSNVESDPVESNPPITTFFYVLSGLSVIGGIILAVVFLPTETSYARNLPTAAYVWSIVWISVGVIEAALFAAIGRALALLTKIAANTVAAKIA